MCCIWNLIGLKQYRPLRSRILMWSTWLIWTETHWGCWAIERSKRHAYANCTLDTAAWLSFHPLHSMEWAKFFKFSIYPAITWPHYQITSWRDSPSSSNAQNKFNINKIRSIDSKCIEFPFAELSTSKIISSKIFKSMRCLPPFCRHWKDLISAEARMPRSALRISTSQ